jgi:hypothetical protein
VESAGSSDAGSSTSTGKNVFNTPVFWQTLAVISIFGLFLVLYAYAGQVLNGVYDKQRFTIALQQLAVQRQLTMVRQRLYVLEEESSPHQFAPNTTTSLLSQLRMREGSSSSMTGTSGGSTSTSINTNPSASGSGKSAWHVAARTLKITTQEAIEAAAKTRRVKEIALLRARASQLENSANALDSCVTVLEVACAVSPIKIYGIKADGSLTVFFFSGLVSFYSTVAATYISLSKIVQ